MDIDRQIAHRFDEELPIPRAVATGKDEARLRANIRPEELEVHRPRMAGAALEPGLHEAWVKRRPCVTKETPYADRQRAKPPRVDAAAGALLHPSAAQMAGPP